MGNKFDPILGRYRQDDLGSELFDNTNVLSANINSRGLYNTAGSQVIGWGQSGYAFYASNGSGYGVYLDDGAYAINANGPVHFTSYTTIDAYLQAQGILVNETSPINNANAFDCNGQGGFYGSGGAMKAEFGNSAYAAYFYDGLTTTYLCNSVYGLDTTGAANAASYYAAGVPGYTGALNDSSSTQIADVSGGIITAVYY